MPAYEKPPARPVDIYLINGTQMRRILGKRSFVLSILVNSWYSLFKDNTYADACLDRLVFKAYRLEFNGKNMRNPNL